MKSKKRLYPRETAGYLMTRNIPVVTQGTTVGDVEDYVIKNASGFESINYIYVVDEENKLMGTFPLQLVFTTRNSIKIDTLITRKSLSVRAHTDQEHVALMALRHGLKSVPVVDRNNILLGAVTSDTILSILHNESVEDILRFGGVLHTGIENKVSFDDVLKLPLIMSLKHRLPWLIVGLMGGLLAAGIVNSFEALIAQNIILASFIPLIVYMAAAVGTQMEAFIIRDLAVIPKLRFLGYFGRHSVIVIIMGLLISLLIYGITYVLYNNTQISAVLSLALFFAVLSSLFTGLVIPYLFAKMDMDPANASGPVATIIQDMLSITVYFAIASTVL